MVDLSEGRARKPLKEERAVQTETPQPPPRRSSPRDSKRYPKEIPFILYLLCFLGGAFFSIALLKVWQPTWLTCAVEDPEVPVVEIPVVEVPIAEAPEVTIAVMGATGSGKSTFINLISGSDFGIGGGLRSFTNSVQATDPFYVDDRRVVLIDTPGFDDTSLSDTEVLNMTATFLADSYEQGKKLAGVLYFHRISDFRMTGISRRNLEMFKKLCGENALQNVVVVTNMWGEVTVEVGNKREAELKREDDFFKPVLDKGARMARHENSFSTAEEIIRLIIGNHPLPLRIQEELVEEDMIISETGAGKELNQILDAQIKKHQEEMRKLKEEMEQAMKDKDEEVRREIEVEMMRLLERMEGLLSDKERLESDYKRRIAKLDKIIRASKDKEVEMQEELGRLTEIVNDRWSFLKIFLPPTKVTR